LRWALTAAPEAIGVMNAIGLLLDRMGRFEEAVAAYGEAIAKAPDFAPALANRATALMALARLNAARADYEAAAALDPANLIAANGLAALALMRGDLAEARRQAEAVLAREPGFPGAVTTLAGADLAEGRPEAAATALAALLEDKRPTPVDPAKSHVFLVGFPRSGTTLIEQVLEEHPDVTTLAGKECLIDATRDWLADAARFARFCEAEDDALEPYRDAYWRRVGEEGADPAGRVFVDKHPFNSFKLPLIARLFPDARVLFARRDPRDIILSCFRHRFQMTDPVWQMLTLEGTAALYDATMQMVEASEEAFGLFTHPVQLEALIADFDGETKVVCDFIGIAWDEGMRDFAAGVKERGVFTPSAPQLAQGLNAQGVGKW